MGIRAVIRIKGKPMFVTHWDGNPSSLGVDLAKTDGSIKEVLRIAKKHNIDFADKKVVELLNEERLAQIAQKANLSSGKNLYDVAKLKALQAEGKALSFGVQTPEDYPIEPIEKDTPDGEYGEWSYDLKDGKVYARKVEDYYKLGEKINQPTLITTQNAGDYEQKIDKLEEDANLRLQIADAKSDPKEGIRLIQTRVESSGHAEGDNWVVDSYKNELTERDKKKVGALLSIPKVRNLIGKGWHYESLRHKLASYGIKTNAMKGNMPKMRSIYKNQYAGRL